METHETLLLWRMRAPVHGGIHVVRCSMDHLGEGYFELRLSCGRELLCNEPFENTELLLRRAEELRTETKAGVH
jgi:hypothetical protein